VGEPPAAGPPWVTVAATRAAAATEVADEAGTDRAINRLLSRGLVQLRIDANGQPWIRLTPAGQQVKATLEQQQPP
jgi:hypothetical protein